MENCEYCNYFSGKKKGSDGFFIKALCTFTDTLLYMNSDKKNDEYPCRNVSYQSYLERKKKQDSIPVQKVTDIKFIYSKVHPVPERIRSKAVL